MKKQITNQMKNYIRNGIISFLFVLSINYYFFPDNAFSTRSTLNIFLAFFTYGFLAWVQDKQPEEHIRKYAYIFSLIYSCSLYFGKMINDTNRIDHFFTLPGFLWACVTIVSGVFVFGNISGFLLNLLRRRTEKEIKIEAWRSNKYIYFILWAFIFLMWIPCYLAYYPGLFEYDMWTQTYQAGGVFPITKVQPPLHTLFWKLCLKAGSAWDMQPITIYTIVQMLVLSALFSGIITSFIKRKTQEGFVTIMLFFFSLNPVVTLFCMEPTKDVVFGVFFILAVYAIWQFISDTEEYCRKKRNYVWMIVSITGCCLFRNNAIYVFILCFFVFIIIYRKCWKNILALFFAPIIVFYLIDIAVFPAMGIGKGDAKEILSVPMQQIALTAVTHDEDLSAEMKDNINQYLPYEDIKKYYNPRFADPVKSSFNTEFFEENKAGFIRLWFSLLKKYPKDYFSAFMALNLPYWYPDAASVDPYSARRYIETGITDTTVYTFKRNSKFPWLYNQYEKVADYSAFEKIPFVAVLFSIATPFWSLIVCTFVFLAQKRKKLILALLPGFFLWLTYMAGPVSNFRYIFPLFLQYPLLLAMILYGNLPKPAGSKQPESPVR